MSVRIRDEMHRILRAVVASAALFLDERKFKAIIYAENDAHNTA